MAQDRLMNPSSLSSPRVSSRRKNSRRPWLALALLLTVPLGVHAKSEIEARYPFDPVCPWGRLANGKGMLHRCINQVEAESLVRGEAAQEKETAIEKPAKTSSEKKPKTSLPKEYLLTVGPIKAESGDISVGRLHLPEDRYRKCIDDHGGMKSQHATIVVKFLVRGEKLRAEGVSVESYKGVSKIAANCIAEVVDRRKVGAPSVELTAARLTFDLRTKK